MDSNMLLLYNNIDFSQNTNKDANNIVSIIKFNEYLKKIKKVIPVSITYI